MTETDPERLEKEKERKKTNKFDIVLKKKKNKNVSRLEGFARLDQRKKGHQHERERQNALKA